jgi:hypothetical protein
MRDYRAYILGIDGHRFIRVKDFLSDYRDDAAALNAAKQLTDKHDVEVWDCARLVALLSSGGEVTLSPGLVPSLVFAPRCQTEKGSVELPVEQISLGSVSELASAASTESNPFV